MSDEEHHVAGNGNLCNVVFRFLVSPSPVSLWYLPYLLCLGGFAASMILYYPGIPVMLQHHEIHSGIYTDWHPPIFTATIRFLALTCADEQTGLNVLYVLSCLFAWLGFFLVLSASRSFWQYVHLPVWQLSVILALLAAVCFDLVSVSRFVSKDYLMFACWLSAAGCLLHMPAGIVQRSIMGMTIFCLLAYGTALRHNAVFALLPMLCWLVWHFLPAKNRNIVPILLISGFLFGGILCLNHTITYSVLHCYRLYPMMERFYADIFMLNYFDPVDYKNPPNGFGNKFDDCTEELFHKEYLHRSMYVPDAFRNVARALNRPFRLVAEGERIADDENPGNAGGIPYSEYQHFPEDYAALHQAWIERIAASPVVYVYVRSYFVLRFLFIDTPTALFTLTGCLCNGAACMLLCALIVLLSVLKRSMDVAAMVFAWSAVLYVLPLFIFLTGDGPGNIRFLYWFYAASFIAIVYFFANSKLFGELVQTVQRYLEERANGGTTD